MKKIIFSIALLVIVVTGCNNNNTNKETKAAEPDSANVPSTTTNSQQSPSVDEAIAAYLQIKNALTNDDGKGAAEAGKHLYDALQKLDNASFKADEKKVYDDVKEDIKEDAEHISNNGGKIAHQREHFDMLSKDMYDLVKAVKPGQPLYKDYCPMFNDKKGAIWLSEVKEIKNPYYGKKMLSCGKEEEEIK